MQRHSYSAFARTMRRDEPHHNLFAIAELAMGCLMPNDGLLFGFADAPENDMQRHQLREWESNLPTRRKRPTRF